MNKLPFVYWRIGATVRNTFVAVFDLSDYFDYLFSCLDTQSNSKFVLIWNFNSIAHRMSVLFFFLLFWIMLHNLTYKFSNFLRFSVWWTSIMASVSPVKSTNFRLSWLNNWIEAEFCATIYRCNSHGIFKKANINIQLKLKCMYRMGYFECMTWNLRVFCFDAAFFLV